MPKVEQYGSARAEQRVTQGARASDVAPGAFGGAIAKGIGDLGRGMLEMQQRVDKTAAEEALLGFERDKNDLFFNPDKGYFNTQGRDAYESAKSTSEALDKLKTQYAGTLTSDMAKRAFSSAADAHITRSRADISRHSASGIQAWEAATVKSQAENTLENSMLYWNDPERLSVQRELGRRAVTNAAALEGIDGEALNERLQTYESKFAMGSFSAAVNKSYATGKATFDDIKDRLEGPDRLKAEQMLKQTMKAEEVQNTAAAASGAAMYAAENFDGLSEAMAYINKNVRDPKTNKAALSEVKQRFDLKEYANRVDQEAIYTDAEEAIADGTTSGEWIFNNYQQFEKLTPKQQRAIEQGTLTVTDQTVWNEIQSMPLSTLKGIDINDYSQSLDVADRKTLGTMIKDAREGKFDVEIQTQAQEVGAAMESIIGREKKDWNKDQKETANLMQSQINSQIVQMTDVLKRKPNREEVRKVIADVAGSVVKQRKGFFGGTVEDEVTIADIPPEEFKLVREEAIRRAAALNQPAPTTQAVIQLWIKANK